MSKTIKVNLSAKSINEAIKELQARKSWIEQKSAEMTEKLAFLGATATSLNYARAIFDLYNWEQQRISFTRAAKRIRGPGHGRVMNSEITPSQCAATVSTCSIREKAAPTGTEIW